MDGRELCRRCLFGDAEPVCIYPIGVVRNQQQRDSSDFGVADRTPVSSIVLCDGQQRFMHGLEDEFRLTIVYYLHRARPVRSRFARGLDGRVVGVFASRTPDRLSRIGIQDVELLAVNDCSLAVSGLDAIDGTPVLDIKLGWHPKPGNG